MKRIIITILVCLLIASTAVSAGYYVDPIASGENLVLSYLNQDPDPVSPGSDVELRFKIENKGAEKADNVKVEILPQYPFSVQNGESAVKEIGTLHGGQDGGEAVYVKFKLKVDKDATTGENNIDVRYGSDKVGWIKLEDNVVNVQSAFATLAIRDVITDPETISPGEKATLKISVENTAGALLKDIKVKLLFLQTRTTTTSVTDKELPFTPIGSSNEKTLNNLARGAKQTIEFEIMAESDADAGSYKVPLEVSFVDNTGTEFSLSNNFISLVVGGEPDLVTLVEDFEMDAKGNSGTASVKFINKGTSNIKFLYSVLKESDDYDILGPESVYVGNIDSDDYENAEYHLDINTRKAEITLPLSIEYRDANNELYKKDIKTNLKIKSFKTASAAKAGGGSPITGFIVIVIIVGGGIFFYRRWKKKNKAKKQ